jgi:TPR repeat protein
MKSRWKLLTVLAVICLALGCERKKPQTATFQDTKARAQEGDATAENNLGAMYEHGLWVTKDEADAVRWYRKAAEQGDACAQVNLGWMYENGHGVALDPAEAVRWYRMAADRGMPSRSAILARCMPEARV